MIREADSEQRPRLIRTRRGGTGPCLIKRVIQGPRGSTFPAGTASISYFVGRYGLLAMTEGEQGGPKGMERYVRETYFPVVKAHGSKTGWKADGDFAVRTSASCDFMLVLSLAAK